MFYDLGDKDKSIIRPICLQIQPLQAAQSPMFQLILKFFPVSHKQKCLTNGFYCTFDIKSNYFDPVILKKLEKFGKIG